jgi:hypothetical protein
VKGISPHAMSAPAATASAGTMLLRFSFVHNYHGDNGIAVCYVLFRFAITKWNLRTPGREPDTEFEAHEDANLSDAQEIS